MTVSASETSNPEGSGSTSVADDAVFISSDPELSPWLDDLRRIAVMPDGALRNLFITQRYHDVSQRMKQELGGTNVNWCTFACWASKTAGESIRGEEIPEFARELLDSEGVIEKILTWFKELLGLSDGHSDVELFDDVRDVLAGVSSQIAMGNLKVYAEIAPLFVRAIVQLGKSTEVDEAAWSKFTEILRDGPPETGGQDLLRQAFREYYEARFVPVPNLLAQKILLANVLVGLHEQTRLQSAIKGALDIPAEEVLDELVMRAAKKRVPTEQHAAVRARIKVHAAILRPILIDGWERIATRFAMSLALPGGGSVNLGEDVPAVDGKMFPEALSRLDYAPLVKVVHQYDRNPESTLGSGASDWSELKDRMNFILDLFRANQQNQRLYSEPFTDGQRADFEAGRMPTDQTRL